MKRFLMIIPFFALCAFSVRADCPELNVEELDIRLERLERIVYDLHRREGLPSIGSGSLSAELSEVAREYRSRRIRSIECP